MFKIQYIKTLNKPLALEIKFTVVINIEGWRHMADKYKKTVSEETATLTIGDKTFELPIFVGSTGPDVAK